MILLIPLAVRSQYNNQASQMMNFNYGQYNYCAIGYTYENNGKVNWLVDLQGTDEVGLRLTGGYRLGSEMYNVSVMAGRTQFTSLKPFKLTQNTFTWSIRAQVWILNFQMIKDINQSPFVSIGLRGNILK